VKEAMMRSLLAMMIITLEEVMAEDVVEEAEVAVPTEVMNLMKTVLKALKKSQLLMETMGKSMRVLLQEVVISEDVEGAEVKKTLTLTLDKAVEEGQGVAGLGETALKEMRNVKDPDQEETAQNLMRIAVRKVMDLTMM